MNLVVALALAVSIQTGPAEADVGCVTGRFAETLGNSIIEEAVSGISGPARAAVAQAAAECGRERGWTAERAERIEWTSAAVLLREAATRRLEDERIPLATIDGWFAAQPVAVRMGFDLSEAIVEDLLAALAEAGVSEEQLATQTDGISAYLAAHIALERIRAAAAD